MPPNRKAHTQIQQRIAGLHGLVNTQTVKEYQPTASAAPVVDSANYWEWPADGAIEEQQQQAKIDDLFSADHIASNLIAAAANNAKHEEEKQQQQDQSDNSSNDYWFMPFNDKTETAPVDEKEDDKDDNNMFSAQHVEDNLVKDATTSSSSQCEQPSPASTTKPEMELYWEWNSFPDRKIQEVLTTQHMEKNLIHDSKLVVSQPQQHLIAANDDYWAF